MKGHSCETQPFNDIAYNTDKGLVTDVAIWTFLKLFDSVNHCKLLCKGKAYVINNKIIQWIDAFLSERKQVVVFNEAESFVAKVSSEVHQGSVLEPLLF